jgi:hypothetical protein
MNDQSVRDRARPTLRERRRGSLQALARGVREILGRDDLESEDQRRAALRRLLHEQAAGLTRDEIEELVRGLRDRFPDRILESQRSARSLAVRAAELEKETTGLREEAGRLRARVAHLESLLDRLIRAVTMPAGQIRSAAGGTPVRRSLPPESEMALVEVATLLFSFALDQEETARSVEETLGRSAGPTSARGLSALLPGLVTAEPPSPETLEAIRQRLRSLQLLPAALLAGAQQSWKGGTREILEQLDPKGEDIRVIGVRNYPAILKEIRRKFQEFWDQFDRNIEHYYRGRFERTYRDKMEDGT